MTYRVKIQSVKFLMLLFGTESLTSLVYRNIKHKLTVTETWLVILRHQPVSPVLQKTPEMHQ